MNRSLLEYAESCTGIEDDLLKEVNRQTHLKTFYPHMISGKVQGKFLEMMVHMLKPQRILEVGTFTGYSALAMAKALPENGLLYTIDNNEEVKDMACRFFDKAPYGHKIRFILGNAMEIIPSLNETFDLIFIDADKENYPEYYSLSLRKLRKNGFILADNIWWNGKVIGEKTNPDKETKGIIKFTERVKQDDRVEQVFLTLRDGLMLIRKK